MSARSVIEHALTVYYDGDAKLAGKVIDQYRDASAHELAERQRAAIPDIMEEWGGSLHQDMLSDLIKVIDPEVPGG